LARRTAGIGELVLIGVWISAAVLPYSYFLYAEARLKTKILLISIFEIPLYLLLVWVGVKYFGVIGASVAWSLRILIDAFFMLGLAGALRTALFSLSSLLLVILSSLLVYYFDTNEIWRWISIIALTCSSMVIHRKLCLEIYKRLIARRVSN
jgi:hypothetical protein